MEFRVFAARAPLVVQNGESMAVIINFPGGGEKFRYFGDSINFRTVEVAPRSNESVT